MWPLSSRGIRPQWQGHKKCGFPYLLQSSNIKFNNVKNLNLYKRQRKMLLMLISVHMILFSELLSILIDRQVLQDLFCYDLTELILQIFTQHRVSFGKESRKKFLFYWSDHQGPNISPPQAQCHIVLPTTKNFSFLRLL